MIKKKFVILIINLVVLSIFFFSVLISINLLGWNVFKKYNPEDESVDPCYVRFSLNKATSEYKGESKEFALDGYIKQVSSTTKTILTVGLILSVIAFIIAILSYFYKKLVYVEAVLLLLIIIVTITGVIYYNEMAGRLWYDERFDLNDYSIYVPFTPFENGYTAETNDLGDSYSPMICIIMSAIIFIFIPFQVLQNERVFKRKEEPIRAIEID